MSHICHITTSHPPFDTRIFKRECQSLREAGYRVTLIARHDKEEEVDGVHVIPLRDYNGFFDRFLALPREAARLAQTVKADLYHFHDPELLPPMRNLARRVTVPVVWDAHEVYVDSINTLNSLKIQPLSYVGAKAFGSLEMSAALKDLAAVVTINELMAERYLSKGVETCILGNIPDVDTFPAPIAKKSPIPRFISTGGQFEQRGVFHHADAVILARKQIECEAGVWGTYNPPGLDETIRQRMLAGGVPAEAIHIGGPYPWRELMTELIPTGWAGAVIFDQIVPCLADGIPNRFFEYWANGIPVVVSKGTYVSKIAEREGGGIIADINAESVADAFLQLAKNPAMAERMGQAGREAVKRTYNWRTAFKALLELYAKLGVRPKAAA